jgi:hypothetical protein
MNLRLGLLLAFTLLAIGAAVLLPAVSQPLEYHDFADKREAFGIGNFLDVSSNLAFAIAGLAGLLVTLRPRTCFADASERWPYGVFFIGVLLTAAGSAYYHLAPDNETLFWDRLPMTISFMSLLSAQIVDRINARLGVALLAPLLLVGMASVIYWIVTERAGRGNVVPYAVLQGYSVVILVVLAASHPSRYTRGAAIYWVFAAYVLAKLFEHFDRQLLAVGGFISGHSVKHIAAAIGAVIVCHMLWRRTLAETPAARPTATERLAQATS